MYYPKLKKLREFNQNDEIIKKIDKFIASLPKNTRFSPLIFLKEFNLSKDLSEEISFYCVNEEILDIKYEITCPECSTDVLTISSLDNIPKGHTKCDICNESFIPQEEDIYIFLYSIENQKIITDFKPESVSPISFKKLNKENPLLNIIQDNDLFGIDQNHLESLIELVETATTNDEKKRTLEDLTEFLFESIHNCHVFKKDFRTPTSELDLILENENTFHPFLKDIGFTFPIECKNWKEPIGSNEIRDFGRDIQKRQLKFGILISKKGVTGNKYKDAVREIADFFKEGITIIVLDLKDIKRVASGQNLITILRNKKMQIQFEWC